MEEKKQGNMVDFVQARQVAALGNEQVCISPDGETLYPFSIEYETIPGRRTHLPFYARDRQDAERVFELIKQGKIAEERTVKWIKQDITK